MMDKLKEFLTDYLASPRVRSVLLGLLSTVSVTLIVRRLLQRTGRVVKKWKDHYDFVIVGAGSAGCVVANRLTADGRFSVLLLEAGEEETNYPLIPIPMAAALNCSVASCMWQDYTTPQDNSQGYNDQRSYTQHGKVLGGSSSVNWMLYARGHRDDYDSWEKLGCAGWGWRSVEKYFRKMEDYTCSDRGELGHGGPLTVSENINFRYADTLIKASTELGIAHNPSYNSGINNGSSHVHVTTKNGQRCSTAKAYLRPAMGRSNLHVVTGAHTTKILFDGKRAAGVRFIRDGGYSYEVFADKEVIVSAGAINSPHLLLLSGVGPKEELEKHGVPVVADLPVGDNYQDHAAVFHNVFFDKGNDAGAIDKNELDSLSCRLKYTLAAKGLLSANPVHMMSFMDVQDGSYVMNEKMPRVQICALGFCMADEDGPYVKSLNFNPTMVKRYYENKNRIGTLIDAVVLHPYGTGSITLASADPLDRPLIDPKLLSDPRDHEAAKAGLKFIRDLVGTPTMQSLGAYEIDVRYPSRDRLAPEVDPNSDQYLDEVIKHHTGVLYHPAGSCKMGQRGDASAVVDPQLRVQGGIDRLRVVDNSIMPHLTSGNTNAPAIMIGEKGSDMILQSYAL